MCRTTVSVTELCHKVGPGGRRADVTLGTAADATVAIAETPNANSNIPWTVNDKMTFNLLGSNCAG